MNTLYIFGAKYLFFFSLLLGLMWFLKLSKEIKKQVILIGGVSGILAFIVSRAASHFFVDPRPFVQSNTTPLIPHAADNGFPSDHMLLVSLIASVVSLYNRKLGVWLWIVAFLVGISRVLVSVHHVIDIIGSICIVLLSVAVAYFMEKKRRNAILQGIK